MNIIKNKPARKLAIGISAMALIGITAGSATAHVTITPTEAEANSYTLLTVGVPHGCESSPTRSVEIKIPEQVLTVTPTVNPGWTVNTTKTKLDEPVKDSHGNEITERTSEVSYTAKTPLPADLRDAFELSIKVPDVAGQTLVFPTVQKCTKGEAAWVQTAAEGQDAHELEYPAPAITVLPASESGHGDGDNHSTTSETTASSGTSTVSWIALVVGVLGLALGCAAFIKTRNKS